MSMVLDSAALIALERDERRMWARLKEAAKAGDLPRTHGGVIGQVWRNGSRQARLAQALAAVEVMAIDEELGRSAGELLAATGQSDVVDAAVVLLARDGDEIVTSDLDDLEPLVAATGQHVELIRP